MKKPILEVNNLSVGFKMDGQKSDLSLAIDDMSVKAYRGEILTIVGASGSGKSILANSILGLLPRNAITDGEIIYDGKKVDEQLLKEIRGKEITFIPQSISSLDPLAKVDSQVRNFSKDSSVIQRQRNIFKDFKLSSDTEKKYPFQLSGGMARRVLIATTVIEDPHLVIADEPTPGLDIESAKKTMNHLRRLADEDKAVILITHDIELAARYSDKLAIFYAGQILELTKAKYFKESSEQLRHPYTRALYKSLPTNEFKPIEGHQPLPNKDDKACVFRDRCPLRVRICDEKVMTQNYDDEMVKCNVDITGTKYKISV